MKKIFSVYIITGIILLQFGGCTKEEVIDPTEISDTPSITFISLTPNPAIKYQDVIKITFDYIDGDGDLGENTPDVKNLFITDSRNGVVYEKRINQLGPDTASVIAIKGSIIVDLSPQGFVDDNHTTETATYSIYIKDRAGHQSNTIQTTTLTINK